MTRPVLLADIANDKLYVFMARLTRPRAIYMKTTDMHGNLEFDNSIGTKVIGDDSFDNINNPTSTKQCITAEMGIVVAASDTDDDYYFHAYIPPTVVGDPPVISSFSQASGLRGSNVDIFGNFLDNVSQVTFNGETASFTVVSSTQLTAVVPLNATTGKIAVTNPAGTATSTSDFTVIIPQYTLTTAVVGSGSVSPASGTFDENSVVTITATPDPGWAFSGWSGDASGLTNPLNLTMDSDKNITATFVQIPQYTLTTTVVGSGSVSPASGTFDENSVVTITATPDPGWAFSGWSGDASGLTNPLNLTMDGDKNITAIFVQIPQYTL
ncbi:MAG: hypothetical protein D6800_13525, partial [Candidatus Zixiibacteriota bacterium]